MSSPDTRIFKLKTLIDRQLAASYIMGLPEGNWTITVSDKPPKRSVAQNALLWAYNTAIGEQMIPPQTKDDTHFWLKFKILGTKPKTIQGITFNKIPETKDLSVKEMQEYLLEIEAMALTAGYNLPAPSYREDAIR